MSGPSVLVLQLDTPQAQAQLPSLGPLTLAVTFLWPESCATGDPTPEAEGVGPSLWKFPAATLDTRCH